MCKAIWILLLNFFHLFCAQHLPIKSSAWLQRPHQASCSPEPCGRVVRLRYQARTGIMLQGGRMNSLGDSSLIFLSPACWITPESTGHLYGRLAQAAYHRRHHFSDPFVIPIYISRIRVGAWFPLSSLEQTYSFCETSIHRPSIGPSRCLASEVIFQRG